MSVSLVKGQKVDLTKGNAGLKKIIVGLGWDEAEQEKKSSIFGSRKKANIDCDAAALLCDQSGKITSNGDVVYYGALKHSSGSVQHMGDNLTGAGEGDDEQITVDLSAVPTKLSKIVFIANVYQAKARNQHFGMIKNAYIRIVDAGSNKELCRYNLSENYEGMNCMIFGELYRKDSEWKFNAIGSANTDDGINDVVKRFK